jgi:hypothetical protein
MLVVTFVASLSLTLLEFALHNSKDARYGVQTTIGLGLLTGFLYVINRNARE